MKIQRVEALHLRLPEVKQVADGTQDVLIVRVHTDDGRVGLGEVVSCSYVGRAVIESPRSAPFRHGLAAIVTGMDVDDIDVAAVKAALAKVDDLDRLDVLGEAEEAGKNRKGVLDAIDSRVDELEE